MTGRFLPSLVALFLLGAPTAALAQTTTDPNTSGYTDTTTTTTTTPPPTATTDPEPEPTTTAEPESEVESQATTSSPTVAPAPTVAADNSTGTTPSTLAYTGSEVWLVGVLGLLALAGGAALMRPSRR